MADAPAPARRKGFDLRNPGGKEYAVVGVATIGLYFIYEWWKNRNAASTAAAAAATTPATTTTPTYGPGTGSSALWLALHDLQGTNTSTTTTTTGTGTAAGTGTGTSTTGTGTTTAAPPAATVTVPVTFGLRATPALAKIQSAGLRAQTSPARNPAKTYQSTGSTPEGGSKVAPGSLITVHVKQL